MMDACDGWIMHVTDGWMHAMDACDGWMDARDG